MSSMSRGASFRAVLTDRRDAGAGLKLVTLTPSPERSRAYRAPGQYVEIRAGAARGFFALGGELESPSWELLVRTNGGASDALSACPEGTVFEVAGPLGSGFPIERARSRPLVLAVAGSALAVARPILRERIGRGEAPATSLYLGVRTSADVPLESEVSAWAGAGVRVVLCLSRSGLDEERGLRDALRGARRAAGYVQEVLAADLREGVVFGKLVFAAGPFGMLATLRELSDRLPGLEVVTNA